MSFERLVEELVTESIHKFVQVARISQVLGTSNHVVLRVLILRIGILAEALSYLSSTASLRARVCKRLQPIDGLWSVSLIRISL